MLGNCPTEFQKYRCENPKILNTFSKPFAVPCGKCLYCRQQKAGEWTHRLELEFLNHENSSFVTLTYKETNPFIDEELFKKSRNLYYKDIQLFLKKLRKQIQIKYGDFKIKFFCAGEYGKNGTQRAHWHLIIFGLKMTPEVNEIIEKCWSYGMSCNKAVETIDGVSRYVSAYVLDKIDVNPSEYHVKHQRKVPIHRGSQGLGLAKALELYTNEALASWVWFKNISTIVYEGRQVRLCRYLRNKIAQKLDILDAVKKEGVQKMQDYLTETIAIYNSFTNGEAFEKPELDVIGRSPLSKKQEQMCKYLSNKEILRISQAWHFRHSRKTQSMKFKFSLWIKEKLSKRVV